MNLRDYAIFKDKAHRVLIFDRARFDAAPRGPKGKPLFIFECDTRGHQDELAGCFMVLRRALIGYEGWREFSQKDPTGPATRS